MTTKGDRSGGAGSISRVPTSRRKTPRWDQEARQLLWCNRVVKEYSQPAKLQELVVTAFEELKWIHRMDDPLPREKGIDPKQRLHDTIKRLNRHHRSPGPIFHGDGTGKGICWDLHRRGRA